MLGEFDYLSSASKGPSSVGATGLHPALELSVNESKSAISWTTKKSASTR
jgi:hypothetical protein